MYHLRLRNRAPSTEVTVRAPSVSPQIVSSVGAGPVSTRARTARSDYPIVFSPVNAVVEEALSHEILYLDEAGNPKDKSRIPIANALDFPNTAMSSYKFLSTLMSGYLTLPQMDVLVWRREGSYVVPGAPVNGFTPDTVAGFTLLPKGARQVVMGREQFTIQTPGGQLVFYNDSVLSLKYALLPDDGWTGISPGSSTSVESQIQRDLGLYQRGFFENGAKPSLLVTIYARTSDEYERMRRDYEAANRGASRQQGVVYQRVVADGISGNGEARIEVKPVGTVNNELALDELTRYTGTRIDGAQGVSPIIYGDASTTTYQNQELVERKFYRTVQQRYQHFLRDLEFELRRVCGDIGFHMGFEEFEKEITQQRMDLSNAARNNTTAFRRLLAMGYSAKQAATMLDLPETWYEEPANPQDASLLVSDVSESDDGDSPEDGMMAANAGAAFSDVRPLASKEVA